MYRTITLKETPWEFMTSQVFGIEVSEADLIRQADEREEVRVKRLITAQRREPLIITEREMREMSQVWEFDRELYA